MRRTQPWVLFLSIVGFISAGFIVVIAVAFHLGIGAQRVGREVPLAALLVYPVLFVLWLFPSLYLYRYARRISRFVAQGHQVQLEAALEAQRRFWSFTGTVALTVVALIALAIMVAIVIGVIAAL